MNTLDYIISLLIVWYISIHYTFERFHYIKTFKEDFYSFRCFKGSLSDQRFDWVRAWQYLYNMPRPSENGLLWIFICAQLYVKVIMGLWQASVPSSTAIRTINFPIVSGDCFGLNKTLCMKENCKTKTKYAAMPLISYLQMIDYWTFSMRCYIYGRTLTIVFYSMM